MKSRASGSKEKDGLRFLGGRLDRKHQVRSSLGVPLNNVDIKISVVFFFGKDPDGGGFEIHLVMSKRHRVNEPDTNVGAWG